MKRILGAGVLALAAIAMLVQPIHADKKASVFVFQQSFINQTGDMPVTTLFTPTEDSDLEISVYVENVSAAQCCGVQATLQWTDDIGAQAQVSGASTGPGQGKVFSVHAKAGQPVSISGTDFHSQFPTQPSQNYTIYVMALGI